MTDPEPSADVRQQAPSVIHYLLPEGCVHVYGDATNAESGVPWEAVARCEAVPWKDGVHKFPAWM